MPQTASGLPAARRWSALLDHGLSCLLTGHMHTHAHSTCTQTNPNPAQHTSSRVVCSIMGSAASSRPYCTSAKPTATPRMIFSCCEEGRWGQEEAGG